MSSEVELPYPIFRELDGTPLESGKIYIGLPGVNPETNPVSVYIDNDRSLSIAQPIRTIGGAPVAGSKPVNLFIGEYEYSLVIRDKNNGLIYSGLNEVGQADDSQWVNLLAAVYISTTQFSLVGDQTSDWHAGRRIKLTGGADRYALILSSAFTTLTTVTVELVTDNADASSTLHASMTTAYMSINSANATAAVPIRQWLADTGDDARNDALVAAKATYIGATATNWHDILEKLPINVAVHFSAVADSDGTTGNGTDNATAFANAIAAAKATGRMLHFPGFSALGSKTGYRTSASLFFGEAVATRTQRGLKGASGDGPENTFVYCETSGAPAIDMVGGRYTIVKDIQFYGVDSASRPSVGVLVARVNVDVGSFVAPSSGEMNFSNVFIKGFFTTSAWYNYSAEWVFFNGGSIENRYLLGLATIIITDTNAFSVAASSNTTIAGDAGVTTYDQQSNIGHYFDGTTIFDYTTDPAVSTADALSNNYAAIKIKSGKDIYFTKCPITTFNDYGTIFEFSENANIIGSGGADANNDSDSLVGVYITNCFFHLVKQTNTQVHFDATTKDNLGMTITDFNFHNNRGRGNGITSTGYVNLNGDFGAGGEYKIECEAIDFSSVSASAGTASRFRDFSRIWVNDSFICNSFFEGEVNFKAAAPTFTIDVTKFTGNHSLLNASSPSTQSLTDAGAVDILHFITELTITTSSAITLADGYETQEKIITMIARTTGVHTLTPSNLAGYTTISFNAVSESVRLLFINGSWVVVGINGATLA